MRRRFRMAWGRKKSGRKEPRFGLSAALADLRLDPKDRIPAAEQKPKKSAKRKVDDDDDDDDDAPSRPPERKSRVSKSGAKRRAKASGRSRLGRLVYWGAVLSLWGAIARRRPRDLGRRASAGDPVAGNPKTSADHPDRRPRRQRAGDPRRNGGLQCRAEGPAALSAEGLHRHRGPPLLFAFRRRSHRHRPRRRRQRAAPRRLAGRLDVDAATREEPVPDPGAHL